MQTDSCVSLSVASECVRPMRCRLKRSEARIQFKSCAHPLLSICGAQATLLWESPLNGETKFGCFPKPGVLGRVEERERGRKMVLNSLPCVLVSLCLVFFSSSPCKARIYTNHWAVRIAGGPEQAEHIANKYGYRNLGQVSVSCTKMFGRISRVIS